MASAIVLITRRVLTILPAWPSELAQLCEYSADDLEVCASRLLDVYDLLNRKLDSGNTAVAVAVTEAAAVNADDAGCGKNRNHKKHKSDKLIRSSPYSSPMKQFNYKVT